MIVVIINPKSGRGSGTLEAREQQKVRLAAHVLERRAVPHRIVSTRYPGHGAILAREAASEHATLIVGWGGDGTINEIAGALVAGAVPLGIVPAGSGNGLARELGIAKDPSRALEQAIDGRSRTIDVGELGDRLFFNVAGMGFDAHMAQRFNEQPGRGFATYLRTGLTELFRYQPRRYTIHGDGDPIDRMALMVVVANGAQYGNGARVAPNASLDDGELDLVLVDARAPWQDVLRTRYLFDGTLARRPGVVTRRITSATIDCGSGPIGFHVDGEFAEAPGPLTVRVHRAALTVRTPS